MFEESVLEEPSDIFDFLQRVNEDTIGWSKQRMSDQTILK